MALDSTHHGRGDGGGDDHEGLEEFAELLVAASARSAEASGMCIGCSMYTAGTRTLGHWLARCIRVEMRRMGCTDLRDERITLKAAEELKEMVEDITTAMYDVYKELQEDEHD